VDPRLHHLQGKAGFVNDLLPLLQEFHRDKLAMLLRHQAAARAVAQYDANNTYQYIINREDTHLSWLTAAIASLGDPPDATMTEPERQADKGRDGWLRLAVDDARDAEAFVERWRPRVESMTNARHRGMLRVILGETLEQKRFFEQAAAGNTELLGRRPDAVGPRVGEVLPTRWVE
jgi:hypothetical protein